MFIGNSEDLKKLAYSIVYEDLKEQELGLFMGKFNPKINNNSFMHGIYTVMAKIALNVNDKTYDSFFDTFTENMHNSKKERSN